MADGTESPNPAPEPETSSAPEPEEPTAEQLKAQLAEERAQNKLYKDTLQALGTRAEPTRDAPGPSAPSPPAMASEQDMIRAIAKDTGYSEEQVQAYFPLMRHTFERLAGPAVQALLGVADKTNELEATLSIKDWKAIKSEAVKVAKEYRARGVMLSHEDAATLARARLGPQIDAAHERETTERTTTATARARAAGGESTVQTARPKAPQRIKTAAELKNMSREDRQKALDAALDGAEF